jgi:hypothetical protein
MGHFTVQPTYIYKASVSIYIGNVKAQQASHWFNLSTWIMSPGKRDKHNLITFLISLTKVTFFPPSLSFKKQM